MGRVRYILSITRDIVQTFHLICNLISCEIAGFYKNRILFQKAFDPNAYRHTTEMNYVTSQIICLFFNIFVSLCCHFICSFSCFSFYGSRKLCETFFNFSPADGFSANQNFMVLGYIPTRVSSKFVFLIGHQLCIILIATLT